MPTEEHSLAAPRIVRRHEYTAMPWRNGGGVTYEIACAPRGAAQFDWRLSVALIEQGGPFSNFTGYMRAISLVSGAGCVLSGIDAEPVRLATPGATRLFPGAAAVTCELLGGPCHDLNLMVREPGGIVSARHLALTDAAQSLTAERQNAVFCLRGAIECVGADDERHVLGEQDTLIVPAGEASRWRVRASSAAAAEAIVHAWFTPS